MNADERRLALDSITQQIIACVYTVSNKLGIGFLEKVYENALAIELAKAGLVVKQQHPVLVHYEGAVVGEYVADLMVNESVIIELKS